MSESRTPHHTPLLLASVCNAEEAAIAAAAGIDLVDAKDPLRGALGALPTPIVAEIVAAVGGRSQTSAVAGEADDRDVPITAIAAVGETGVDFVKVAVHAGYGNAALARMATASGSRLIGVAFAEDGAVLDLPERLAQAGFAGAMIDTRGKDGRAVTSILTTRDLAAFSAACRDHGLICGLAGSLTIADISMLAAIGPDYLGFRGGLCRGGDRRNPLEPQRVAQAVLEMRACRRRSAA